MKKIESEFIKAQYRSGIKSYADFTKKTGLWESEKYVFNKYILKTDRILDLGCGTGRTTFPLFQLGFTNIIGVDLTPEMIGSAKDLNKHFGTDIDFFIGNATGLNFQHSSFDVVIFSFNGLMSIPQTSNRERAVRETHRVLKNSGIFIFTAHDRDEEEQFLQFWFEEKKRWATGHQNALLHEYGDLITHSKNESKEIFIHIPDQKEINDLLGSNGFELVETFYRSEKFEESKEVKDKSGPCRFWVYQKK